MNSDVEIQTFGKGLKNEYDSYLSRVFGDIRKDPKNLLLDTVKYIDCNKKHLIEQTAFDEECKLD